MKETLISKRLVLSLVQTSDILEIYNNFTDNITTYMYPSSASKLEETKNVVNNFIKNINDSKELVYVIRNVNNNEFIGLVGLHNLASLTPEPGIWIKESASGNKYGMEAVYMIANLATMLNYKSLYYPVDKRNVKSSRIPMSLVYEKNDIEREVIVNENKTLYMHEYIIDLEKSKTLIAEFLK